MIKTFEQFDRDILCEGSEWWSEEIYTVIISYDNEVKHIYNTVSQHAVISRIREFAEYISILTRANMEELKGQDLHKKIIKGYTLKNPTINMGWKTCSIVLIKGGEPFDEFKEYINTLKKQVNDLKATEKKNKLK